MRKALKIIALVSALSLTLMGLMAGGPCGNDGNEESNRNGNVMAGAEASVGPDISLPDAPDPEGTVRFTLVYQSDVNAEFKPCG